MWKLADKLPDRPGNFHIFIFPHFHIFLISTLSDFPSFPPTFAPQQKTYGDKIFTAYRGGTFPVAEAD